MNLQQSNPGNEKVSSLWSQLLNGEKAGLEGIYRCFAKELFLYGSSIDDDQDLVQDCIHDVFIELWKYHKNLQKADNVKVYLFKALSYKLFRELKKRKKWAYDELSSINEYLFVTPSQESKIVSQQVDEKLKLAIGNALSMLPTRQREVIHYVFFQEFSYEEISSIMGINLRSVYTLAWKAIASLKKKIGHSLFLCVVLFGLVNLF